MARSSDNLSLTLQKAAGLGSKDFRTAYRRISRFWLQEIDNGFAREVDPYGNQWEHLSPRTIRDKRRRKSRFPTAILQDTQQLRHSFQAEVTRKGFSIFSDREFDDGKTAEFHQLGGYTEEGFLVPARPMLPLGELPLHWIQAAEGYLGDDLDRMFS